MAAQRQGAVIVPPRLPMIGRFCGPVTLLARWRRSLAFRPLLPLASQMPFSIHSSRSQFRGSRRKMAENQGKLRERFENAPRRITAAPNRLERAENCYFRHGGEGWIRTSVRLRGQIYSLLPLTTRPPLHEVRQARHMTAAAKTVNAARVDASLVKRAWARPVPELVSGLSRNWSG